MKRIFPLAIVVVIGAASLEIIALIKINQFRIVKAAAFYNESKSAENEEKVLLIIKSNTLAPSKSKNEEIISHFLERGEFDKAEKYLKKDKTQRGLEKYVEAALECAQFTKAEEAINKIDDIEKKAEFNIFLKFAKGDNESINDLPKEPKTSSGRLIQALNTNNYKDSGRLDSALGRKIYKISAEFPKETAQLEIAKVLFNNKQYHLSLFLLKDQERKKKNLLELHVLKGQNYYKLNDLASALKEQKIAISIAPEEADLHKTAINYARAAGNMTESTYFSEQLRYLELIQK